MVTYLRSFIRDQATRKYVIEAYEGHIYMPQTIEPSYYARLYAKWISTANPGTRVVF